MGRQPWKRLSAQVIISITPFLTRTNPKADSERLTAGNYIREKNKTFSVTLKVKRAYAKTTSPRRAACKELDAISQFIGAAEIGDQPHKNDLKYREIAPEEFQEAVDKH